jgi:AraC-like DNA-binding protein
MKGNPASRADLMKPVPIPSHYSVRATIAALLHHGDASLQHTAYRLGGSPRSLQRHLTQMGTSYSELVAEVRLDTACHLLAESDQSISSIAFRLGYSGASSFSRTFRRLMKIQPVVYRRQQMARMEGRRCRDSEHSAQPDRPSTVERLARNGKTRRRAP